MARSSEGPHLSEGHADAPGDMRDGPALRVVLQEDAVSLENHIWLPLHHLGWGGRREAHGVLEFPAIGCHLGTVGWKDKLMSAGTAESYYPPEIL